MLEDAPPPSHHGIGRQRLSIKAFWSYLDLCGSTWSYIYNLSLAPLQARLVWWIRVTSPVESPSVYVLLLSPS